MWSAPRAASEAPEPVTWHRKWVLLLVALGWLFLVRYRALGWLLSQALTLQLRWSSARLRTARVHIECVRFSPLRCGRVELSCDADWCVVITSTRVTTHLKEFFQSYGQRKLLDVTLDDVVVDVRRVDLDVVRAVVRKQNDSAMRKRATATPSASNAQEGSPMGFMRFVDVRIARIAIRVDIFDLSLRLRCAAFSMSIPRVFLDQNYLHLSVEAREIHASCQHLETSKSEPPIGAILTEIPAERDDAERVAAALPHGVAVFSVRLSDTSCIGCAINGNSSDVSVFRVATAFILHLQTKYVDLLQSELLPLPSTLLRDAASSRSTASASGSAFALSFELLPVEIRVLHSAQANAPQLLTLTMTIDRFSRDRSPGGTSVISAAASAAVAASSSSPSHQTQTELRVHDVTVVLHSASRLDLARVSQATIRVEQRNESGSVRVQLTDAHVALDPSSCAACHSLVAFSETIDAHDRRVAPLLRELIQQRGDKDISQLSTPPTKPLTHWRLRTEIQSCSLQLWVVCSVDGQVRVPAIDMSFDGAVVESVLPPRTSRAAVVHTVEIARLQGTIASASASASAERHTSSQPHTIAARELHVRSTAKTNTPTSKTTELRLQCGDVSINSLRRGQLEPALASKLPAICVRQLDVHVDESALTAVHAIAMAELDVVWSHERHLAWLQHVTHAIETLERARVVLLGATDGRRAESNAASASARSLKVDAVVTDGRVCVRDIAGVASSVEFAATQAKVQVQKTESLASATAVHCGFLKLLWDDSSPVAEISGIAVQQQQQQPVSNDASLVPATSNVAFSDLKLWCAPERRLLLLMLRLEELTRGNERASSSSSSSSSSGGGAGSRGSKPSVRQGIGFSCGSVSLTLYPGPPSHGATASCVISMNAFEFKGVLTKCHAIGEPLLRFLQVAQLDDDARSQFALTLEQTMEIDSTITIGSIDVGPTAQQALARVRQLHVKLSLSDVSRRSLPQVVTATGSRVPLRITLFDVSATASVCRLHIDRTLRSIADTSARVLSSVCRTDAEPSTVSSTSSDDARLRYVGTLDAGVARLIVCAPCGATSDDLGTSDARLLQLSVSHVGVKTRQLHKASLQLEELTVWLVDHDDDDDDDDDERAQELHGSRGSRVGNHDFVHRLLYVPRIRWEAAVHYVSKRPGADTESDEEEDESEALASAFAVSFELVFSGKTLSSNTHVPEYGESLLSLHWDHVYPLLVTLCTEDDEDDDDDDTDGSVNLRTNDEEQLLPSATPSLASRCLGVQWNVSVDVLQVTWWDSLSQDVAVLIVANDLLAHGSARRLQRVSSQWTVLESTVYLDLFRGYLLKEGERIDNDAVDENDCGVARGRAAHSEPFETVPSSRFFFETAGTSYREYFSSPSQCAGPTAADLTDALFGEPTPALVERLHEAFVPLEISFRAATAGRLHRMDALPNAPSFPPPTGTAAAASTLANVNSGGMLASSSQPRSPRGWAQSMRAKVARLKRRTSSMDNLFLDDGSCPIQVDSMKLLWTIETRDCAFYMIEVTVDSVSAILDARKQQQQRDPLPVSDSHSGLSPPSLKSQSSRPPTTVHSPRTTASAPAPTPIAAPTDSHGRPGRRASTRETLLELLHEGKLGKKAAVSPTNEPTCTGDKLKTHVPLEEPTLPTRIAFKKYTVDVHDAQINMLEDASRSSALVASKHIHFEIGYDDAQCTTIATLSFDCVTAHVAPIDVDISAGVLWYSHSSRSPPMTSPLPTASPPSMARHASPGSAALLKRVLEECSLSTCYSQSIASGAIAVEADLSFLQLTTDRHQFFQLLNVLRHVLLAPPTVVQRTKRGVGLSRRLASTDNVRQASETEAVHAMAASSPSPHPPLGSSSNKKLHALIEEEMRMRDSKSLGTTRGQQGVLKLTSFRVVGCTFRLRASPETSGAEHEFGEIRVDGLTGSHSFFANQCTKLTLSLQWLEINNLRPGPSSIAFEDPTSVLKAKLLQEQRLETTGRKLAGAQKSMLTIRAESGPPTRVLGQKLRVLDVLEVSIFPDVPNMVVIQLAADFYEVLYKFFFEQVVSPASHHDGSGSEHLLFGKKANSTSNINAHAALHSASSSTTSAASPFARSRPPSTPSSPQASGIVSRRKSIQISSISVTTTESSFTSVTSQTAGLPSPTSPTSPHGDFGADEEDAEGRELFYFKYVRIGNLRLRINCNGFVVNLNNFDLDLPPYVCQSKLCTWKKLLHRFESHLKWYLTKETASTGLSHFKNRLLRWTPIEKKEKQTKKEGDSVNMNAQVLFGPYSGGSAATSER